MAEAASLHPHHTYTYESREYTAHIPTYWRAYHTMADIPETCPGRPCGPACTRATSRAGLGVCPSTRARQGQECEAPNYDITYTSKTIA